MVSIWWFTKQGVPLPSTQGKYKSVCFICICIIFPIIYCDNFSKMASVKDLVKIFHQVGQLFRHEVLMMANEIFIFMGIFSKKKYHGKQVSFSWDLIIINYIWYFVFKFVKKFLHTFKSSFGWSYTCVQILIWSKACG